jgi:hypothetical protein
MSEVVEAVGVLVVIEKIVISVIGKIVISEKLVTLER